MTLTILHDFRDKLGLARNQGRRPTCLGFAASAAHGHAHNYSGDLCVEWLYYHAVQLSGGGHNDGSTLDDTRAVLASIGQPDETFWPYQPVLHNPASWAPPAGAPSPVLKCSSQGCNAQFADVWQFIEQGKPVVLALLISDTFYGWQMIGNEAVVADDSTPVDPNRGHAVVAVGCGTHQNTRLILVRNSWGSNWGKTGHAWISEAYVTHRLIDAFAMS